MGLALEALPPPLRAYAETKLAGRGVTWQAANSYSVEMRFIVQAALSRDEERALKVLTESGGTIGGLAKAIGMNEPILNTIFNRWQQETEPYPILQLRRHDALESADAVIEVVEDKAGRGSWASNRLIIFGGLVGALAAAGGVSALFLMKPSAPPPVEIPKGQISGPPIAVTERSGALRYGVDMPTALRRLREAGVDEVICQEMRSGWNCRTRDGRDAKDIITKVDRPSGSSASSSGSPHH
jgi:hypothetical protein